MGLCVVLSHPAIRTLGSCWVRGWGMVRAFTRSHDGGVEQDSTACSQTPYPVPPAADICSRFWLQREEDRGQSCVCYSPGQVYTLTPAPGPAQLWEVCVYMHAHMHVCVCGPQQFTKKHIKWPSRLNNCPPLAPCSHQSSPLKVKAQAETAASQKYMCG